MSEGLEMAVFLSVVPKSYLLFELGILDTSVMGPFDR